MKNIFKNKKPFFLASLFGLGITCAVLTSSSSAVEYTPLLVSGKGTLTIAYEVDDTKSITNYSGVDSAIACIDCRDELNLTYTMLDGGSYVTNAYGTVVSRVNDGDLTYFSYEIPEDTEDGKHWLCIQTEDNTAKTINGTFQEGNLSLAEDNVSCVRFYYDITAPTSSDLVVNNNNSYTNNDYIPVTLSFADNYAGIKSITYEDGYGNTVTVSEDDYTCTRNTTAGNGEGSWTCKMDTTIKVNSDRSDADIYFTITDNVNNIHTTQSVNIKFDKILPEGTVEIHEDGEGVVNSQTGYVEYHVTDPTGNPWIYPSGLIKVTVSELDGSHEVVLLDEPDLTTDKNTSLDGILTDYLLTTCYEGEVSVKLYVADRAGNYTGDENNPDEIIISNSVVCALAKVSRFDVVSVINPGIYTESLPFSVLSWVFNDGDAEEGMEGDILAPLLAGAETSFEFDVEWSGDIAAVATATYTVTVVNDAEGYEKSFNGALSGSDFSLNSNGYKYSSFEETITMPKDAPVGSDVYITIDVTISSVEGGLNKVTTSSALFDKYGDNALWGTITGSIEDYLYFGATN